jgi:hypothetical protein
MVLFGIVFQMIFHKKIIFLVFIFLDFVDILILKIVLKKILPF